jgi:hypothetical protein
MRFNAETDVRLPSMPSWQWLTISFSPPTNWGNGHPRAPTAYLVYQVTVQLTVDEEHRTESEAGHGTRLFQVAVMGRRSEKGDIRQFFQPDFPAESFRFVAMKDEEVGRWILGDDVTRGEIERIAKEFRKAIEATLPVIPAS